MTEHFRAFSFVDRIDPGSTSTRIEGGYFIPKTLDSFPSSLAAEAVGQLAAWSAMHSCNFARRPIAGIAGKIDLLGVARPGDFLNLMVDIESLDEEAVAYRGSAAVNGSPVIVLEDCVGPMIPVPDLDDPAALRDRFALLCGPGAKPEAFQGLPPLVLQPTGGEKGTSARATFKVPAQAPLFADHFPRRPVFPGSLLVQVSLQLAAHLASEIPPPRSGRWKLQSVVGMKLREFIPPGQELELEAQLKQHNGDAATLLVSARAGQELAGSARLLLVAEGC